MALREIVKGGFLVGVALGAGAAVVGPVVWRTARPYAKSALRAGLEGYAAARVAAARMGEEVEDLVAEVLHEMTEAEAGAGEAGAEAADAPTEASEQAG